LEHSGLQFGTYETFGGGGYGGVGASLTKSVTFSRNKNINDLAGPAGNVGMGFGEFGVGSLELNKPFNFSFSEGASFEEGVVSSYTANLGIGMGTLVEGHGFVTYTWVHEGALW